ncbi:dTDP-glucose 4,6-dehydratase [Candidatus Woesebacteria bacterium RIFOXYB1_FULL_41_13]|uniref:dTDP-glucose 4,6-dehydratase n=1 Tax=Candidatus Woesebacteria bacterium RIFOXYB1_FULL_41_13 TaxID=1802540 RepID=A0A1F8D0U0_9BACT|nr:MAG: dTDP-glucose 4,6-dehydratase [Candidatus Woesebacteria bacterium RIFOXYB1_FULL_41_13]
MKLLVTGAAGFIGSNFVHYWLEKYPNDEIRVIDALTYAGNIENLTPVINKIKFYEADINDRAKVDEALKGVDAVVHFAAESHVDRSIFDPSRYWQTNVHGTITLLEEAHKLGITRFHHISTDEVYGELPLDSSDKFSEKTPYAPRPDNLYALSKAEADKVVMDFYHNTDMFITISNCSNNYGPYQFPEKFIPIVVTNLIDNIKVPVHGDGKNVRDWIHARDHASAIDLILQKGAKGETYLVGSDNDRNNDYIARQIVNLYGKDEKVIRHVPDRHSNDRRYAIDATKIITELGWRPEIGRDNFDDGLKETVEWYKNNQDWWRPLLKRRALITDEEKVVSAFITLDRETGKTKFIFGKLEDQDKIKLPEDDLKEHFVEGNLVRFEIVKKNLQSKKWYQESSDEVKRQIEALSLNPATFGYVEDLSLREDKMNGDTLLKITKIVHADPEFGIYGIATWFEVVNPENIKRMEGYFSWGWGPKSGAKLLVLIRRRGEITHFAFQRETRFPTGSVVYNLAGGFPKLNESVLNFIIRSLKKDLNLDIKDGDITLNEIVSLGRVIPDSGITNNHPNLYAVILDFDETKFPELQAGDKFEEEKGIVLWPVSEVSEIVSKCDDSYFLAAMARLTLSGIYTINLSENNKKND